jgi:hypothetical protein
MLLIAWPNCLPSCAHTPVQLHTGAVQVVRWLLPLSTSGPRCARLGTAARWNAAPYSCLMQIVLYPELKEGLLRTGDALSTGRGLSRATRPRQVVNCTLSGRRKARWMLRYARALAHSPGTSQSVNVWRRFWSSVTVTIRSPRSGVLPSIPVHTRMNTSNVASSLIRNAVKLPLAVLLVPHIVPRVRCSGFKRYGCCTADSIISSIVPCVTCCLQGHS